MFYNSQAIEKERLIFGKKVPFIRDIRELLSYLLGHLVASFSLEDLKRNGNTDPRCGC